VGALNSAHIFGTLVPVEEPSTASTTDSCTAAMRLIIRAEPGYPFQRWRHCGHI